MQEEEWGDWSEVRNWKLREGHVVHGDGGCNKPDLHLLQYLSAPYPSRDTCHPPLPPSSNSLALKLSLSLVPCNTRPQSEDPV